MKRIYAYFDGSNFYHTCKNNYGVKGVKFNHLVNNLIDKEKEELIRIKYFTAPVNQQECPELYASQQKFFHKLKTTPLMDVKLGSLVKRKLNKINIVCPDCGNQKSEVLNCPKCENTVNVRNTYKTTEKGVDVGLAINLLLDALNNKYDIAFLFSSDADFCPAIRHIIKELGKEVVYLHFPKPRTYELLDCCSSSKLITKEIIEKSLID
jgi:uncharacterized LabA/DUF88 family protein